MAYGNIMGTYAPQMEQPYPIETNLAEMAYGKNPGMAALALNDYQWERSMREGDYAGRLADQMAFGQQQLLAQRQETALKALPDLAKTGLLPAVASSPEYGSALQTMNPGALQYAINLNDAAAQAANYKNAGQGAQGFGNAGVNVSTTGLGDILGNPNVGYGLSIPEKVANIRGNAEIEAAKLRAAGGGAGTGPSMSLVGAPDPSAGGAQLHVNWGPKTQQTPEGALAYGRAHNLIGNGQQPNPNASGAPNTAPPPVIQRQPLSNLPMAQRDTPANAPTPPPTTTTKQTLTPGTVLNQTDPGVKAGADAIRALIAKSQSMPPQQKADLQNFKLQVGPDSRVHLHGASGRDYGAVGQ